MKDEKTPSSRVEALAVGADRYFTGKPCKHGHLTERVTSNSVCVGCWKLNYEKRKSSILAKKKQSYQADPEPAKARAAAYRKANPEKVKELYASWQKDNREHVKKYLKDWHAKRREEQPVGCDKARAYRAAWARNKRRTDPDFMCAEAARLMLRRCQAIKTDRDGLPTRTEKLIGYTAKELRDHIDRQFLDGMSWDNRGEWHIDHIVPVSELVALGVRDPKRINSLGNLRPLWAVDNLRKSASFALCVQVAI